ncbi:FCA [Symbiodinium natans]|uniref:FCA protein n=1 Tax=Symbiodinium natans TaxID=878477 RepID=A0A812QCV1_9DINO|nr:FCA [Symbiodinium natans]
MNRSHLSMHVGHVTAAIRACWNSEGRSDNAARMLYSFMLDIGLEPNIVTFTCLLGAHEAASVEDIWKIYTDMQQAGVQADVVFAETFLITVLRKPKAVKWDYDEAVVALRGLEPHRIQAAQAALMHFKKTKVRLSTLSSRIDRALQRIAAEGT